MLSSTVLNVTSLIYRTTPKGKGFPSRFERAVYGILRNLIEIVILLYLLVYNFALFSKFAPLTLANFEKGYFVCIG